VSLSSCFRLSGLLCGLVPDCGSVIAWFNSSDSRMLQIVLMPTTWSHPTLAGIKLVILLLLATSYPLVHGLRRCSLLQTYRRDDRATLRECVRITLLLSEFSMG
jgi:hypothetical protein